MTKLSSNNNQMRLSIPQGDSTLNFKGFSLADLREINEVRFKMALFRERINKKLFFMHIRAGRKIEAQIVTPISYPEKNWPNIQKDTDMKMMECRMCPRKANFPQQDIPKGNLDYFICRDCSQNLEKSGLLKDNCKDHASDSMDDESIIITNVRSLSTQNVVQQLEPMSPAIQQDKPDKSLTTNSNVVVVSSDERSVEKEKYETVPTKTMRVLTAEGYVSFIVPYNFKNRTSDFALVSGQTSGTENDPIIIDKYN